MIGIEMLKAVLLLAGLLRYGAPAGWDVAARLTLYVYPETSPRVELLLDPVAIFRSPLPDRLCGYALGSYVVLDPKPGCSNTLEHELNHIWQGRSYEILMPPSYALDADFWEAHPSWTAEDMFAPRRLNWALLQFGF